MADDVVRRGQRAGLGPDVVREDEIMADGVVTDAQARRKEVVHLSGDAAHDQVVRDRVSGLATDHVAAEPCEPQSEVHAAVRDPQVVRDVQVAHAVEDERLVGRAEWPPRR